MLTHSPILSSHLLLKCSFNFLKLTFIVCVFVCTYYDTNMEARELPTGITFLLYPHGSQQKISELGLAESAFIYFDNKLAHSFLEISIFGIFLVYGGDFQSFF